MSGKIPLAFKARKIAGVDYAHESTQWTNTCVDQKLKITFPSGHIK
jgi:hypothetical protein